MSTVVSGIDGRVTTLEGRSYKRKIYTGAPSLSCNWSSILKGTIDIGFNGYVCFMVIGAAGTPYAQVSRLYAVGGPQIWDLYAAGSGFVSGHRLQVICLGIET